MAGWGFLTCAMAKEVSEPIGGITEAALNVVPAVGKAVRKTSRLYGQTP